VTEDEQRSHGLIPSSARATIPGSPQSVAEVLDPPVASAPDREALVGRHARFTYAELDREVNRAANALRELGVGPGVRVAGAMGNHTELVVGFFACMRLGAIWLGIARALAPPEKAYLLRDAGARVLLADREAAAQLAPLRAELADLVHLVDAEPAEPASEWRSRLAAAGAGRPRVEIDPFAPAAISYTSGTTGMPKGAVHSQHNLLLPGAVSRWLGRSGPEITQAVCLPLTTLNLMVLGPVLSAQTHAKCVLMDRIDALGVAEWVCRERIASFAAVPTTFFDLLNHPEIPHEQLASLTRPAVGGAPPPEALKSLFRSRFGFELQEGYGLTEAPTTVAQRERSMPIVPGSCGTALPHLRIAVLGEGGEALPLGEVGEVCVGPQTSGPWAHVYTTMLGYWNQREATEQTLRGGWLHTGDLGCLDADGNLFIKDRRSDLILRGGANVYPAEIERVLHADPRVAACAVLSVPDDRLGERVVAAVQLASDAKASEDELREHCRNQLARYKVPDRIVFVASFPRNSMNKILKRELRPLFQ